MKLTWMHVVLMFCTAASGACEALMHYSQAGNPLPFHITAATLAVVAMVCGTISKSALPPSPPAGQ
jgi:hypothetical protein